MNTKEIFIVTKARRDKKKKPDFTTSQMEAEQQTFWTSRLNTLYKVQLELKLDLFVLSAGLLGNLSVIV